ncbi:N-acylhomoserine lactone synthase ExpI [Pectobacterium carotovorum subsp. carotovorum]|uniref:Acyl-homoserine-lactone synthase n=1 Tax=Pectobacterium carotovorum subsp. carotovorum TaxID=555 RepID=A0A510DQI8_PECCC|nr:N-acylhomoserine lactone synthase ExpI [Pectobacterium carotovorum subsp. carotovorum]BBE36904.1 N-acylhomoserine lactone synthase ExpI [Pectobacterium carotovorum subsp. carotovorum]BBE36911.1 N-acylhomoserine lactone synthase ExpI [Pectobacterium carotovorum subsp. carotovorum]BBE36916.1 N-acylhomoserine lactone synthase ExpI [Pectobacterium carotovorum subsp. carotovorum]GKW17898.1 N-acylhomoserine lactone synthase ExpI [Pectobacterium carotovorum subsp. carotovorum]
MLEIFDVNHTLLSETKSEELFTLRKETFKDRLNWAVQCTDGMEFDQYDNNNTTYLFGMKDNTVICSLRFIETKYPNMITGTFFPYFKEINIPEGNYLESSRFFVDKSRAKDILGNDYPISSMLFLSMINYSRDKGYDGIYTIVSHPMLTILKRSGWGIRVVEQGLSEKEERVYLVFLPVDDENQEALARRINRKGTFMSDELKQWPLRVPAAIAQV